MKQKKSNIFGRWESGINVPPDGVICNIAIYADDIKLYSKCEQTSGLWQQLEFFFWTWIWPTKQCRLRQKVAFRFQCQKISGFFIWCYWHFFLIEIHSMQGWTATVMHGVTRKRSTKLLKHTGKLFVERTYSEKVSVNSRLTAI